MVERLLTNAAFQISLEILKQTFKMLVRRFQESLSVGLTGFVNIVAYQWHALSFGSDSSRWMIYIHITSSDQQST